MALNLLASSIDRLNNKYSFLYISFCINIKDLCRPEKPGANDTDLERYARMIFWICGNFSTRWGGLFVGKKTIESFIILEMI